MPAINRLMMMLVPGLVLFALGLAFVVIQAGRLSGYEAVEASILRVDTSPHPLGGHTPLVSYDYLQDGRRIRARGVTPLGLGGSKQWARTQERQWPVNSKVTAYFDPDADLRANPGAGGSAFLVGRVYFLPYGAMLLGVWAFFVPLSQLPRGGILRPAPIVGKPDGHGWYPIEADDQAKQLGLFESGIGLMIVLLTVMIAAHYWLTGQTHPRSDGYLDPWAHLTWASGLAAIVMTALGFARVFRQSAVGEVRVVMTRAEATLHDRVVVRAETSGRSSVRHTSLSLVCDRFELFSKHRRFGLLQELVHEGPEHKKQHVYELPRSRQPKSKPVFHRTKLPREEWSFEAQFTLKDGRKITRRLPFPVADPHIKPIKLEDLTAPGSVGQPEHKAA